MADMTFITRLKPIASGFYDASISYEANSLVTSPDGTTVYLTVQSVPAGTPLNNTEYFVVHTDLSSVVQALTRTFDGFTDEQSASGNPVSCSPVPYTAFSELKLTLSLPEESENLSPENIQPLEAVSAVKLVHCGKNLLNMNRREYTVNGITFTFDAQAGSVRISGTKENAGSSAICYLPLSLPLPAGKYALSLGNASTLGDSSYTAGLRLCLRKTVNGVNSYTAGAYASELNGSTAFTSDGGHTQLQLRVGEGIDSLDITLYPQLEIGENVTAFEPYHGALYSFDTDGEIVEGEVDLIEGSIETERTYRIFKGSSSEDDGSTSGESWGKVGTARPYYAINIGEMDSLPKTGARCSHFKSAETVTSSTTETNVCAVIASSAYKADRFAIRPAIDGVTDRDSWADYLKAQFIAGTPVQASWKLAEPKKTALSPLSLTAFEGKNTLWTNLTTLKTSFRLSKLTALEERIAALEGTNTATLTEEVE